MTQPHQGGPHTRRKVHYGSVSGRWSMAPCGCETVDTTTGGFRKKFCQAHKDEVELQRDRVSRRLFARDNALFDIQWDGQNIFVVSTARNTQGPYRIPAGYFRKRRGADTFDCFLYDPTASLEEVEARNRDHALQVMEAHASKRAEWLHKEQADRIIGDAIRKAAELGSAGAMGSIPDYSKYIMKKIGDVFLNREPVCKAKT